MGFHFIAIGGLAVAGAIGLGFLMTLTEWMGGVRYPQMPHIYLIPLICGIGLIGLGSKLFIAEQGRR